MTPFSRPASTWSSRLGIVLQTNLTPQSDVQLTTGQQVVPTTTFRTNISTLRPQLDTGLRTNLDVLREQSSTDLRTGITEQTSTALEVAVADGQPDAVLEEIRRQADTTILTTGERIALDPEPIAPEPAPAAPLPDAGSPWFPTGPAPSMPAPILPPDLPAYVAPAVEAAIADGNDDVAEEILRQFPCGGGRGPWMPGVLWQIPDTATPAAGAWPPPRGPRMPAALPPMVPRDYAAGGYGQACSPWYKER